MASSSKKRTTMAKLNREHAVRERRLRKQARKDARKQATEDPASPGLSVDVAALEGQRAGEAGEPGVDGEQQPAE